MGDVVQLWPKPTLQERYDHFKSVATAFVEAMRIGISTAEAAGDNELVDLIRSMCLDPWEAALREDLTGDLWLICEACGQPIKDDSEWISGDGCDLHRKCAEGMGFRT